MTYRPREYEDVPGQPRPGSPQPILLGYPGQFQPMADQLYLSPYLDASNQGFLTGTAYETQLQQPMYGNYLTQQQHQQQQQLQATYSNIDPALLLECYENSTPATDSNTCPEALCIICNYQEEYVRMIDIVTMEGAIAVSQNPLGYPLCRRHRSLDECGLSGVLENLLLSNVVQQCTESSMFGIYLPGKTVFRLDLNATELLNKQPNTKAETLNLLYTGLHVADCHPGPWKVALDACSALALCTETPKRIQIDFQRWDFHLNGLWFWRVLRFVWCRLREIETLNQVEFLCQPGFNRWVEDVCMPGRDQQSKQEWAQLHEEYQCKVQEAETDIAEAESEIERLYPLSFEDPVTYQSEVASIETAIKEGPQARLAFAESCLFNNKRWHANRWPTVFGPVAQQDLRLFYKEDMRFQRCEDCRRDLNDYCQCEMLEDSVIVEWNEANTTPRSTA